MFFLAVVVRTADHTFIGQLSLVIYDYPLMIIQAKSLPSPAESKAHRVRLRLKCTLRPSDICNVTDIS
jgi:hypothetical protein